MAYKNPIFYIDMKSKGIFVYSLSMWHLFQCAATFWGACEVDFDLQKKSPFQQLTVLVVVWPLSAMRDFYWKKCVCVCVFVCCRKHDRSYDSVLQYCPGVTRMARAPSALHQRRKPCRNYLKGEDTHTHTVNCQNNTKSEPCNMLRCEKH